MHHIYNYICTATGVGGISEDIRARVTVRDYQSGPPTASITPQYRTIGQRDTVTVVCQTSGDPAPSVTWSKVQETLDSPNIRVTGNVLTLSNAAVSDRGMYLCTVENSVGSARASAIIEVEPRELPVIEIYPDNRQTISTGGSVLFQCRASAGIPSPTVTWTRDDRRPLGSNVEILPGGVIRMTRVT